MFSCTCCEVPRSFSIKKSLYRHQRNTGTYEDPRAKDARERREAYARVPKSCEACGIEFSYEDVVTGSKVKYCSRSCASKVNNLVPKRVAAPKPPRKERSDKGVRRPASKELPKCIVCGDQTKHRHSQKFCTLRCQADHRQNKLEEAWMTGEIAGGTVFSVRSFVRRYLHRVNGSKCWDCGWDRIHPVTGKVPLQIDHVDGNASNNTVNNLRLICPNCHSLTPNFGALNRGNGREFRRKRYQEGKSY